MKLPTYAEEMVYGRLCRDAICPKCGDQAFYVDLSEDGEDQFAFSCDSCEYWINGDQDPSLLELARKIGMRT